MKYFPSILVDAAKFVGIGDRFAQEPVPVGSQDPLKVFGCNQVL
ncbi:MAG: hypothetical protein A4E36_01190 [Methanoregulaceae archaeon PtaB.Bin009]|nr:MAG: hypothetical protein A4E36_01190 [Methanoregulaceae archaeon PtaB.Bin009]